MIDVDSVMAKAQVRLTFTVTLAFVMIIVLWTAAVFFLLMHPSLPASVTAIATTLLATLTGLLGTLGTIFTLQHNFFFARHRPPSSPDSGPIDSKTAPPAPADKANAAPPSP